MKKFAITLCLALCLTGTSFAYYEEGTMQKIDVLRAQGFSESTIQSVDTATRMNRGKNGKTTAAFTKKTGKNALGRSYTAIKNYFDPLQDDGNFGEHQIQFTNTWNDDVPEYANKFNDSYSVENL